MDVLQILNQLGIDPGSMLFYAVNFLTLLVGLTFLVYRPLFSYLEQRQQTIQTSIEEAKELQSLLEAERAQMHALRTEMEQQMRIETDKLRTRMQENEAKLLQEMEEKRSMLLAQAREQIAAEKASLLKEVEGKTIEVIKDVVLYVLQNKVPRDVVEESVTDAWKTYTS